MLRFALLAALLLAPASAQRFELVADNAFNWPQLNRQTAAVPIAVGNQGQWAAYIFGESGRGLVVNGAVVATSATLAGERPSAAFNSTGRLAWSSRIASTYRLVLDGQVALTTGAPTGSGSLTWERFFVRSFSSSGRILLQGAVSVSSGPSREALGYVDVDANGSVIGRGLIAVAGGPTPAGIPGTLDRILNATMSAQGHVLWQAAVTTPTSEPAEYVLLDDAVVHSTLRPSPFPGEDWDLGSKNLSLSSDGTQWAMSGRLGTGLTDGILANGTVRYTDSTVIPDLEYFTRVRSHAAVIDDAGELLYTGDVDVAPAFGIGGVLMRNESVVVQGGVTAIFGHVWNVRWANSWSSVTGSRLMDLLVSPNRRYALTRLWRPGGSDAIALLDLESSPLPCGSFADAYEPNDGCAAATPVTVSAENEADLGLALVTRGLDEDWYEIPTAFDEVTRIRALHLARDTEVDFEVFGGGCGALQPLAAADRDTRDEGVLVRTPPGVNRLFVRVFVPDRSPSSCAEYSLEVRADSQPLCSHLLFADDELEPNDRPEHAVPLSLGIYGRLNISSVDSDYFTVELPPLSTAVIEFPHPFFGVRVYEILDSDLHFKTVLSYSNLATLGNVTTEPVTKLIQFELFDGGLPSHGCGEYDLSLRLIDG